MAYSYLITAALPCQVMYLRGSIVILGHLDPEIHFLQVEEPIGFQVRLKSLYSERQYP